MIVWPLAAALILGLGGCQATKPDIRVAQPATAAANNQTLEIRAVDLAYQPVVLNVAKPGRYPIKLINAGQMPHDVTFPDGTRISAAPGETTLGEVEVPAGGFRFNCSVPGHTHAGMTGEIQVVGNEVKPRAGHSVSAAAAPVAPPDPTAPPLMLGNVHDIDLIAIEAPVTIAKGVTQQLWTYNGTVPGPVIRVKVGDTIRMHFKNTVGNKLPHSVDFHASQVAWNDEMTSIKPGEEKLYEWRADYAGVWMYHCGSNPALHHIASGMYGMVIVEPRKGLAPVDHELALVQSEFYAGSPGDITDLHKAGHDKPDYVVFNGVANQYKEHPIPVETGKKVRVFVMNAGPNEDSAFHIVGTIFNRVIKEGMELKPGNAGNWGSQAVDLAPSQGAIVEFTTPEDGLYPIVTHAFNFVGKGALGLLKAGDGEPSH
jgi:nitrite reductase (NO-forming)